MMFRSTHFWKFWLPPHLLAVFGLLFVHDAKVLFTFLVSYVFISGLGVAVGFHRYFSHKAFATSKFWQHAMLYFGCLACHGHPLFWVALHRGLHHRFSDEERDPHSPRHGIWQAYQGYAFSIDPKTVPLKAAADFLRAKDWQWSVKHYSRVVHGTWLALAALSLLVGPWLIVGVALAQVWAIHQEALVNVVGHVNGLGAYRNYETADKSVNRPILGLLTWGQALHNNHHGDAGNPDFGSVRPYEFDPSMIWIKLIRRAT